MCSGAASDTLKSIWGVWYAGSHREVVDTFKHETFKTAEECIAERSRSKSRVASREMLENIEES